MRLKDAASFFMKQPIYDAYSSAVLFNAQTSGFDDHSSSGATSRRRVMSVRDGTAMPARAVVALLGDNWIVGSGIPEALQGQTLRVNYPLKKSTGLLAKLTPGQACLQAAGTAMHAHKTYFKDTVDTVTKSDTDVMWNVFCPLGEGVARGTFFRDSDSRLYRVRDAYASDEGFTVAEADDFDAASLQSVTFQSNGAYNGVTDSFAAAPVTTKAILLDHTDFYVFSTQHSAVDRKAGDKTMFVAASAVTPKVGALLTFQSKTWNVTQVAAELDAWALNVRLA